jgi:hypothetical protein
MAPLAAAPREFDQISMGIAKRGVAAPDGVIKSFTKGSVVEVLS